MVAQTVAPNLYFSYLAHISSLYLSLGIQWHWLSGSLQNLDLSPNFFNNKWFLWYLSIWTAKLYLLYFWYGFYFCMCLEFLYLNLNSFNCCIIFALEMFLAVRWMNFNSIFYLKSNPLDVILNMIWSSSSVVLLFLFLHIDWFLTWSIQYLPTRKCLTITHKLMRHEWLP